VTKLGLILSTLSVTCLWLFRHYVDKPAMMRLPDGYYGEMYGPVSYFRIPINVVFILTLLTGLILSVLGLTNRNRGK